MAQKKVINVEGAAIGILETQESDCISITDIDSKFDGKGRHIENWLRNQNTIEYLTTWETLYNPSFNSMHLHGIKTKTGLNRSAFLFMALSHIPTICLERIPKIKSKGVKRTKGSPDMEPQAYTCKNQLPNTYRSNQREIDP